MPEDTKFYHGDLGGTTSLVLPFRLDLWHSFLSKGLLKFESQNINGTVFITGTRAGDIFDQNSSENFTKGVKR